jgi:hypothetical protein
MIDPKAPESAAVVSKRIVRQFAGILVVLGAALVAAWAIPEPGLVGRGAARAGAVAGVLGLIGLMYPPFMRPIFLLAMAVTRPIGHVLSLLILGVMYFVIFTPLGLIFRAARRDPLGLKKGSTSTYWADWPKSGTVMAYTHLYQSQHPGITYGEREERPTAGIGQRPAPAADS